MSFLYQSEMWLLSTNESQQQKRNSCFHFPIRLVRCEEAGQRAGDNWILVTHWVGYWSMHGRPPRATTDNDACVCLGVCGRLCVHYPVNMRKITSFAGYSVNSAFFFNFVTLPTSLFLNSDSAVTLERHLQFLTNYRLNVSQLETGWQFPDSHWIANNEQTKPHKVEENYMQFASV